MSATIKAFAPAAPSASDLIQRARDLAPVLRERSAATNAARRVPDETIDAFREAGFFRMLQPRRYGGYEEHYGTLIRVLEQLAHGCGSSAWVCSVLSEHPIFVSWFSEQAQDDVWADNPDARISASFAPRPIQAVPGGYRATATWSFSSGCDHAQWAYLGGLTERGMIYMLVPMTDMEIVDDWHVLGLRGTGSKTLKLVDVFIPEHRTIDAAAAMAGTTPGSRAYPDNYLTRTPSTHLPAYSLPSVSLGLAQRALDMFVENAPKHILPGGIPVSEQQIIQADIAETQAEIDMVRLLLREGVDRGVEQLRRAEPLSPADAVEGLRNLKVATQKLVQVVLTLCAHSNSRWVMNDSPMQLIVRDVLTASAHRGAYFDVVLLSGRVMFGLPGRGLS